MRKIFLPPELYEGIKYLSLEDKGKLLDIFYQYNLGIDHDVPENLKIVFGFFKPFFDKDMERHKQYLDTQSENGKKGGRPKKSFENMENSQKAKKAKEPKKATDMTGLDIDKKLLFNKEEYSIVNSFINKDNTQIKYQISKKENYIEDQYQEIDKLIKDGYNIETIKTVLNFVKQDDFWKNQILSVSKLRKKDKNGIPYMVRMLDEIKKRKPKVLDLDQYHNGN